MRDNRSIDLIWWCIVHEMLQWHFFKLQLSTEKIQHMRILSASHSIARPQLADLQRVFDRPIARAAEELGIGLTLLKVFIRILLCFVFSLFLFCPSPGRPKSWASVDRFHIKLSLAHAPPVPCRALIYNMTDRPAQPIDRHE